MNFEKGKDIKHTIGVGKRVLIDKWFAEWAPGTKYVINSDLSIEIEENLHLYNKPITSLPNNLNIVGYLDLRHTKITSLPDNLSVGSLYIFHTKITSLPDDLKVDGGIYKDF